MNRPSPTFIPLSVRIRGSDVRERLLVWFAREGRSFPWRELEGRGLSHSMSTSVTHDPWLILVSEVMLQQTQASRVATRIGPFMDEYPDPRSLARASVSEVLMAWRGMGYNSRGLRLREAAQMIVDRFGGRVPGTYEELRTLPGVGAYTARAVLCFAFGIDITPVDVNIARFLSRVFYGPPGLEHRAPHEAIEGVAAALIPEGDAYRWCQALMDIGATICTARSPSCSACPVASVCLGRNPIATPFSRGRVRKGEPTIGGEPRRIWRGRIVEVLRDHPEGASVQALSKLVRASQPEPEQSFVDQMAVIVHLLVEEGLVEGVGVVSESTERYKHTRYRLAGHVDP